MKRHIPIYSIKEYWFPLSDVCTKKQAFKKWMRGIQKRGFHGTETLGEYVVPFILIKETDKEYSLRIEREQAQEKQNRYEQYLKLKEEFEND